MKLTDARLCLDCDEVHDEQQCPACASESFAFIKRWVAAPERRAAAPAAGAPSGSAPAGAPPSERVATYRALLTGDREPSLTRRLVRGSVVGLAVLGAAGWLLRRNTEKKDGPNGDGEPAE